MGLRQQQKEQMRHRLYETAMALFRERGFRETRVRDIVDRAQVSEATFFNYFPTKEAVLQESSAETKRFYGAYLHNLVARPDEPAADRLRELARVVASFFATDRAFMSLVLTHTDLFFDSAGENKELDVANYTVLAEIFRQGQASGEFRRGDDPQQLAEVFVAVQLMTVMNWTNQWWGPTKQKLEPRLVAALEVVVRGCAAGSWTPAEA